MSKRARNEAAAAARPKTMPNSILRGREQARANEHWRKRLEREEREARQAAARERIRNMKMPSHPEPLTQEQRLNKGWR